MKFQITSQVLILIQTLGNIFEEGCLAAMISKFSIFKILKKIQLATTFLKNIPKILNKYKQNLEPDLKLQINRFPYYLGIS